ncbi:hypothetical protein EG68_10290 [Paragonimus skrjabini miyazakii]|uniref:very-long-chain (3R)-3-hydroxyacyl-CoA dehydratase n=1 Tax=Paragonimus skrjabini miyazakii TaxID=59628 RepID=A0A8S9YLM8_9TREM|nr:hypothetical protein EG68_10290 [Paragonimus skrjabini miyazakii]
MTTVLNYFDCLLRKDDFETLAEGCWINDNIISFVLEYLRHNVLLKRNDILLLDPPLTQIVKLSDTDSAFSLLDSLNCRDKDWIFHIINDSPSATKSGGTHWSLLLVSRPLCATFHLDSLSSDANCDSAGLVARSMALYFNNPTLENVQRLDVVEQINSSDCGVYTIMNSSTPVHPFVKWGQNETHVYLSVQLSDVENVKVNIEDETLTFSATGNGSHGRGPYEFKLDYFLPVIAQQSRYAITGRAVVIRLCKELRETWSRLTIQSERLPWARLDFDLYQFDVSDLEQSDTEDVNLGVKVIHPTKEERERHNAEMKALEDEEEWEAFVKILKNPLTIYLLLFNMFQFAGFLCVCGMLVRFLPTGGDTAKDDWYEMVIDRLVLVQLIAFLEPLHVLLRSTYLKDISESDLVHKLTPHLIGQTVLFFIEGKLIVRALPLLIKSGRFSYPMPNSLNMSFDLPSFLHVYLLCMLPAFYHLMRYMYVQRRRVIGPRPRVGADQMGFLSSIPWLRSIVGANRHKQSTLDRTNALANKHNRLAHTSQLSKLS